MGMLKMVLYAQGIYYVVTGLLPIVSMRVFELITGPKVDDWLVRMVGLLAAVIGATLVLAARRGRFSDELLLLAVGSAISFTVIDVFYAAVGRISMIYFGDAIVEI